MNIVQSNKEVRQKTKSGVDLKKNIVHLDVLNE